MGTVCSEADSSAGQHVRKAQRPTIAYLAPGISGGDTQEIMWSDVATQAEQSDLNMVGVVGGQIGVGQDNILYEMVTPEVFSGAVSWAVKRSGSDQEMEAVLDRFKPLPVVSVNWAMPAYPSVTIDDYHGMQKAISHLIETHGYRHLAFIRATEGHRIAEQRYRSYCETMVQHGLPLDPALVTPAWNWTKESGRQAVALFLDERKLRPKEDIDVIIASSDLIATGVLEELQRREIRVPEDMALVGCANSAQARNAIPSITSVATPLPGPSGKAVHVLLKMLEGKPVPDNVLIPTMLAVHQSCGCQDELVAQAAAYSPPNLKKPDRTMTLFDRRDEIFQTMIAMSGFSPQSDEIIWADELLRAFFSALDAMDSDGFLSVLRDILRRCVGAGKDVLAWQGALSALQSFAGLLREPGRILILISQSRVLISRIVAQAQARRQMELAFHASQLRSLSQQLNSTFDVTHLMKSLTEGMKRLNIPSCFIAVYEGPQAYTYPQPAPEKSRLILAYDKEREIPLDAGGTVFATQKILPEHAWPSGRRFTMILQALYFQDSQIGFVLFETGPSDWPMYSDLRAQISSALQGALLFEQIKERTLQMDKIVAETLTTSEEMLATISEASRQAQAVSTAARESMDVSRTGLETVSETVEGMKDIQRLVDQITRSIDSLSNNSMKIQEILGVEQDIVEQSKMLALNASIQAARAGDLGSGFGIVAREMRTLAAKTDEATVRIGNILEEVSRSAASAVMVSKEGGAGAQLGMERATRAGEVIHNLSAIIEKAAQLSLHIASTTQQQNKAMARLVMAIQSIKEASTRTSTSFQAYSS